MSSFIEEKVRLKNIEYYRVKDGVRMICDNAFSECKKLRSIGLPSSLNFIGKNAFKGCKSLDKVMLPESLVFIGDGAFYCEDPYEKRRIPFCITIPSSVEMIEGNPFCNNTIIYSNNDRYKVINDVLYSSDGKVLISYCSTKDVFVVPDGVERIGVGAFRNTPIRKITFPESLRIIDKEAFISAVSLENVVFPQSLKEIREDAFQWCDFKTGCISFSPNIEKISHTAFGFGWYIKMIKVPLGSIDHFKSILPKEVYNQIYDDEFIYDNFMYFNSDGTELISAISGTESYTIPEGVVKVRDGAFVGIFCIDSIRFPTTLKDISVEAFDYEVQGFKSIFVPKGTKPFYEGIFEPYKEEIKEYELATLPALDLSKPTNHNLLENSQYKQENLSTCLKTEDFENIWTDEFGVKYSGDKTRLLEGNRLMLKSYAIKEGTKVICDGAFVGEYNLKEIFIPNGVVSLGISAFGQCSGLKEIIIPASVSFLHFNPFTGIRCKIICLSMNYKVVITEDSLKNEYYSLYTYDMKTIIHCGHTDVTWHDSNWSHGYDIDPYPVFDKPYIIPNSVQTISSGAFMLAELYQYLEIPSSVKKIEKGAFIDCPLESITLPKQVDIDAEAFIPHNLRCRRMVKKILIPQGSLNYYRSKLPYDIDRIVEY